MNYWKLLNTIKDYFTSDVWVKTVTEGGLADIDLNKMNLYPLVHLEVNQSTATDNTLRYNVTLYCMDVVDMSKEETTDEFSLNDNHQQIQAIAELILLRFYLQAQHGSLFDDYFQIEVNPTLEPFTDRYTNYLAGMKLTCEIVIPLNISICEEDLEELIFRITQDGDFRKTEDGSFRTL